MKTRRNLAVAAVTVVVFGLSCGKFAVVNPYDPRYDTQVTVTGPDSATSVGEILTYTVSATPPWTGSPPVWSADEAGRLKSLGGGRYQVVLIYRDPIITTAVSASVGPHVGEHHVVLAQRVAGFTLQNGSGAVVDTLRFTAYAQVRGLVVAAWDSGGSPINPAIEDPGFVSRDTQVVRAPPPGSPGSPVESVGDGRTWIVATVEGVVDSVPAVVRQVPAAYDCNAVAPFNKLQMGLEDSLQLTVTRWLDSTGHALNSLPVVTGWDMTQRSVDYPAGTSLEMTPTGMVHSNQYANNGVVDVLWRSPDGTATGEVGSCTISSS